MKTELTDYIKGCFDSNKARLYGTFQERTALNITQFPKIQGSLLIRMGLIYPIVSSALEQIGLSKDATNEALGVNYHTWMAGYLAYLIEIEGGLSKYPVESAYSAAKNIMTRFSKKN